MIDEEGKNIGVMSRDKALQLAHDKGLDLIEFSPHAQPPVARIMSFDKYRYQQEKKLKKQRAAQKAQEIKQVQISGRAASNDLQVKARKTNEFLQKGHPIVVILTLRGREKALQGWAHERLQEFLRMLVPHRVVTSPKFMGRGIQTNIVRI